MRTLIYALASVGHGTKRLSRALADLGLFGGHELIGQGSYGSVADVPNALVNTIYSNPVGYPVGVPVGGLVGDDLLADLYFAYADVRWAGRLDAPPSGFAERFLPALERYLRIPFQPDREPLNAFFDFNTHLADFYPILNALGICCRAVHVSRDARRWIQKCMYYYSMTDQSNHYGSIHVPERIYPRRIPEWKNMSPFECLCRYWSALHSWFSKGPFMHFHVEDFNDSAVAAAIGDQLLQDASPDIRSAFSLYDATYDQWTGAPFTIWNSGFPPWEEWSNAEKVLFDECCGPTMADLGYAWRKVKGE